jgi:DNA-binding SARP family transcriptional activator/tetratricopeptide (TPR) repeat protein
MVARESVRLNLIGSPFVSVNGNRLALPTRKLLALLAVLTLEGPTERAQLAQLLWPDLDADARGSLRRELYRLRKTTNAKLLIKQGQLLCLDGVSTDWHDFQSALETQDWAAAATCARGSLLEGLNVESIEFEEWIELHRSKFEDQLRHVLLQYALQLETQTLQHDALEAFERLLRLDALNENAVRGMMRTLEAIGDGTRLLAVYKQFADRLEFELGIQPSNETRRLAAKAKGERLTEQSSHAVRNSSNVSEPRSIQAPLVGRKSALAQLEEAWETGKTILISGEPGMGKSSLMLEFAGHKSKPHEQLLMFNRPGDSQTPYSSLTRMLRSLLRDDGVQKLPNWVRMELARLLPELGEVNASADAEQGKSRLLAAASEFIKLFNQDAQLLIHDDIQFMDQASWELHNNLTLQPNQAVRTIMAYRKNELPVNIQADIHAMIASDQAILIELPGLEQTAVQELVESNFKTTPEQTQTLSQRLHTFTGGNPLFILETLKAIQETGQIETTIQSNAQLPHARRVRDIINSRLERLNKTARDLVRITAIAPESHSLEMVASVLGGDAMNFHDASFELEQTGIMRDGRFTHDALYETALEGIPKPARVLLHNRVLSFLTTQPRLRGTASVYLRHAEGAQNSMQILEWSVLAAKEATERFAYLEALAHYDRALQIETDPSGSFELLWAKCQIYRAEANRDAWSKCLENLLWCGAQSHDVALETRAALAQMDFLLEKADFREVVELAKRLLGAVNLYPEQKADILVIAARALINLEQFEEAEKNLLQAEPLISSKNYLLIARLNIELRSIALKRNQLAEARNRNALVLEACRRDGNRSGELEARFITGVLTEKAGDYDGAGLVYEVAVERAQELRDIPFQRYGAFLMANLQIKRFDIQAINFWVAHGMRLSVDPPDMAYQGVFHEQQAVIHFFQGESRLMFEQGKQALHCYQQLGVSSYEAEQHEWLAHRLIELGQYGAALEHIDRAQILAEREQLTEQHVWILLARTRHHLALGLADEAMNLIRPILQTNQPVLSRAFPSQVVLGQTCLALGHFEQAADLLGSRENLLPDEAFRLATLLQVRKQQGITQGTEIEETENLLLRNLPPICAVELRLAFAQILKTNQAHERATDMINEALEIQNHLLSGLVTGQHKAFLHRIKSTEDQEELSYMAHSPEL